MNHILEEQIFVNIPNFEEEVIYDIMCYDGIAIGFLNDSSATNAPKRIKMEYPKLEEVRANEDLASYVLTYRGFFHLNKNDLHFGDVMMAWRNYQLSTMMFV